MKNIISLTQTLITNAAVISLLLTMVAVTVAAKKPNIVVIFSDDVGTGDVPGYWENSGLVDMPNLEDLLQHGTTFTDAHSTPLCAPSRYVLLSGNYQHRGEKFGGSWTVNYEGNQFRASQRSIADLLKGEGYATSMFGKWHLGGKIPMADGFDAETSPSPVKEFMLSNFRHDWTKPMEQGPWDIGFEKSYVTLAGVQNPPYAFLRDNILDTDLRRLAYWPVGEYERLHGVSKIENEGEGAIEWDSSAYNMILANETEKFIDNQVETNPEQPFFTYVALGGVHTPHSPPDKYIDGTPIAGVHDTAHMDVLAEVDLVVGTIMNKLKEKGILEDTIVVFTSDNGGLGTNTGSDSVYNGHYSGGPLRAEKSSIYEGGHRVPMTIRWDNGNVPKGEKRSHIIGLNDLYATLCEFAGVEIPISQAVDSVSFANYTLNEKRLQGLRKSQGYWSFTKYGNRFLLGYESVRMGHLKLIHDYQNSTLELYDLDKDIGERNDISLTIDPSIIEEMYNELKTFGPCHDMEGEFYVTKQDRNRSCEWFGKTNTWERCEEDFEGWMNCRLTCSMKSSRQCHKVYEVDQ